MRKLSVIALMGTLPLFIGGCEALSFLPWVGGEEEEVVVVEEASPSPEQASPADPSVPSQAFNQPVEPGTQTASTPTASGLIQSTDPNKRASEVASNTGRPDPFSAVPTTPRIRPTARNQKQADAGGEDSVGRDIQGVPALPPIPSTPRFVKPPTPVETGTGATGAGAAGTGAAGAGAAGTTEGVDPGSDGSIPSVAQGPDLIPDLPAVPQPTLAERVKVTGAIQIGGVPHAIVEAPGQQPRYVKVGDYLANGQVLVKRIEMNGGFDPVVILEQSGIEVAKRVGESVPGETVDGSEAASIPNSTAQS